MIKADLHIHTTASDGALTPSEVVQSAVNSSLDAIAITDHDTIAGIQEAKKKAMETGVQVITGVEISTLFQNKECHLLAYAFEEEDAGLVGLLKLQKKRRIQRVQNIISRLNEKGIDISFNEIFGEAGQAVIGRPHIARVLIKKGYVADVKEAFFRYLGNHAYAYQIINYPDTADVISLIRAAGGYSILAHPGSQFNFIDLKELKDKGIDGIECYHPSNTKNQQRRFIDYCTNYGLIATGGSDFHGSLDDISHLGRYFIELDPESPLLTPVNHFA